MRRNSEPKCGRIGTRALQPLQPRGTKPSKRASANLHLNFPAENLDNRVRIMPVDRVDGSWGVIDSNDFNLFTRCFR